jgi:hypothetical protein
MDPSAYLSWGGREVGVGGTVDRILPTNNK